MLFRRTPSPARYELVTRAGCHLCDEMAAVLDEVLPAHGLTWSLVDVDADPELRSRSASVNGRPAAIFWTLAGGWRSSPSWKDQPKAPASRRPIVVLPEPETPITMTIMAPGDIMNP